MARQVTKLKSSYRTYERLMFTFGILAVLYALKHYEKIEDYEECQKIIDAIRNQEKKLDVELFTVITSENIDMVYELFKDQRITKRDIIIRSKMYSKEIINKIEKQNK